MKSHYPTNGLVSYTFRAPAHYASALVNGDCSGLTDRENVQYERWVRRNYHLACEVVDVRDEQHGVCHRTGTTVYLGLRNLRERPHSWDEIRRACYLDRFRRNFEASLDSR